MFSLNSRKTIPLFIGLLFLSLESFADLRCGNQLAQIGDDFSRVLDVCGEPYATYQLGTRYISVEQKAGQVSQGSHVGGGVEYTEAIHSEMWIYKPGSGQLKRILYFENGFLVRVQYGERT